MDEPNGDRRQGDRRRGDRRRRPEPPRPSDESWFGALGVGIDSEGVDASIDPAWTGGADGAPDSRFVAGVAHRSAAGDDSALARIYRTYAAARAAIGVTLVLLQGAGSLLGVRPPALLTLVCVAYAVQAAMLWLLPRFASLARPQTLPRQRHRQWLATIGVDLLAFTLLHLLEAGGSFGLNYAALLVLPVLMAGVLTPRLAALATAAGVALVLLAVAWLGGLAGGEISTLMAQAGLAGMGLFVITLLAGELAARLVREERAARGSLVLARQQAQLNRLVIEEMADGVVVVDHRLRVRAANPAARMLLVDEGLSPPAPFSLAERDAWAPLAQAVRRAFEQGDWPEAGRDLALSFAGGPLRTLRVRMRFTRGRALAAHPGAEPFCMLLLEDVRTAQARIRQEKLAAMGRVSAGVAHEIRNPLAAIAQANALLLEEGLAPTQQRLARIVADNVLRLKRIVDEVMELAPGTAPATVALDATAAIAAAAAEWAGTVELTLGPASRLGVELPAGPLGVLFDPEHLRRVLVNLLDNARRHASDAAGAIVLRLAERDDARAQIVVASDGAPIAPEVEGHLFEPFFSARSRGSGLGLYICRELCERHGASIDYRPRPASERWRNEFVVTLRRAALAAPDVPSLQLMP